MLGSAKGEMERDSIYVTLSGSGEGGWHHMRINNKGAERQKLNFSFSSDLSQLMTAVRRPWSICLGISLPGWDEDWAGWMSAVDGVRGVVWWRCGLRTDCVLCCSSVEFLPRLSWQGDEDPLDMVSYRSQISMLLTMLILLNWRKKKHKHKAIFFLVTNYM